MSVHVRGSFADLLDVRFREIVTEEEQKLHEDMVPVLWNVTPATRPFRETEQWSEVSGLPRAGQFTGQLDYATFSQGYDVSATYVEFAQGIQIERLLMEYDQTSIIEERPRALTRSMFRRRQYDGTRHLRNAFSVDNFFYNHTEGVAMCSNSHTTTTGASTATGFDNLGTAAFSATALAAAQIQAAGFVDMQGEPIEVVLDTICLPIDLYEPAWEAVSSLGKIDSPNNNRNVHYGAYTLIFLRNKVDFTDTNDWFAWDSAYLKENFHWLYQVGPEVEFGFVEDFDTFNAKYRAYTRYTNVRRDWRPLVGFQVT